MGTITEIYNWLTGQSAENSDHGVSSPKCCVYNSSPVLKAQAKITEVLADKL